MQYKNNKGKVVGELLDGVFRKKVQNKHIMKIYDAWGLDEKILDEIEDKCDSIRILNTDTNQVFSTVPEVFRSKGIKGNFDGRQVFLPRQYWEIRDINQPSML